MMSNLLVVEDIEYVHLVTDLCEGGELLDKIVEKANDDGSKTDCFAEEEASRIIYHKYSRQYRTYTSRTLFMEISSPKIYY